MALVIPRYKISPEKAEYKITMITGTLAATLAAGANVWAVQNTSASLAVVVRRIRINMSNVAAFGTAQDVAWSLFAARPYTTAATGGTGATLTGNNGKLDTKYVTISAVADLRISSTAALGAGTWTLDTQPIEDAIMYCGTVGLVAPTFHEFFIGDRSGIQPPVLRFQEGLTLQNRFVWGASGTFILSVVFEWAEVPINEI